MPRTSVYLASSSIYNQHDHQHHILHHHWTSSDRSSNDWVANDAISHDRASNDGTFSCPDTLAKCAHSIAHTCADKYADHINAIAN
jgi:hypothetical protein